MTQQREPAELVRSQSFVRLAQTGGLSEDEVELLYRRAERYARRELSGERQPGEDYVRFVRWGTSYALPVMSLRRIVPIDHVSHVPGGAAHVPGVFSYRGEILSAHDLAAFLGTSASGAPSWALIVQLKERRLGILADEITDLIEIEDADAQPVPLTLGARGGGFRGILADGTLLVLPKLLEDPEFAYAFPPPATP